MRVILIAGAILAAFAAPAWANQCPRSIAALDEQMRQHGSMLSSDKAAQIKDLRNKAEQAHQAGNHGESMQAVQHARNAMGM
jgi:recombinational DNA repair ATPase RecF